MPSGSSGADRIKAKASREAYEQSYGQERPVPINYRVIDDGMASSARHWMLEEDEDDA